MPKGTDFRVISDEEIKDIQNNLNNRPRKRMGFVKPVYRMGLICFDGILAFKIKNCRASLASSKKINTTILRIVAQLHGYID